MLSNPNIKFRCSNSDNTGLNFVNKSKAIIKQIEEQIDQFTVNPRYQLTLVARIALTVPLKMNLISISTEKDRFTGTKLSLTNSTLMFDWSICVEEEFSQVKFSPHDTT